MCIPSMTTIMLHTTTQNQVSYAQSRERSFWQAAPRHITHAANRIGTSHDIVHDLSHGRILSPYLQAVHRHDAQMPPLQSPQSVSRSTALGLALESISHLPTIRLPDAPASTNHTCTSALHSRGNRMPRASSAGKQTDPAVPRTQPSSALGSSTTGTGTGPRGSRSQIQGDAGTGSAGSASAGRPFGTSAPGAESPYGQEQKGGEQQERG